MHAPVTIPDTRFANLFDPRLSRAAGSVRRDWSWSLEQSNRRAPHALRIELPSLRTSRGQVHVTVPALTILRRMTSVRGLS